jgi:hypothetical protein
MTRGGLHELITSTTSLSSSYSPKDLKAVRAIDPARINANIRMSIR